MIRLISCFVCRRKSLGVLVYSVDFQHNILKYTDIFTFDLQLLPSTTLRLWDCIREYSSIEDWEGREDRRKIERVATRPIILLIFFLASRWSNSSRNAKIFFLIGDPPSFPGLDQPSFFDNVLSIFNFSSEKNHFFLKSPACPPLTLDRAIGIFTNGNYGGDFKTRTF